MCTPRARSPSTRRPWRRPSGPGCARCDGRVPRGAAPLRCRSSVRGRLSTALAPPALLRSARAIRTAEASAPHALFHSFRAQSTSGRAQRRPRPAGRRGRPRRWRAAQVRRRDEIHHMRSAVYSQQHTPCRHQPRELAYVSPCRPSLCCAAPTAAADNGAGAGGSGSILACPAAVAQREVRAKERRAGALHAPNPSLCRPETGPPPRLPNWLSPPTLASPSACCARPRRTPRASLGAARAVRRLAGSPRAGPGGASPWSQASAAPPATATATATAWRAPARRRARGGVVAAAAVRPAAATAAAAWAAAARAVRARQRRQRPRARRRAA